MTWWAGSSETRRHRLLLVGFGRRGRQWAREIGRRGDLRVEGIVDPAPDARSLAVRAGLRAWTGLDEALDRAQPDLVVIASPPAEHAEQAVRALEARAAVLIEKPLATSLEAAAGVARASVRAGRPALVAQNYRFRPWARAATRAIAAGWIGSPRSSAVVCVRPASAAPASVRASRHGSLWDIAVHYLDLQRRHFGGVPARVEATRRSGPDPDDPRSVTYVVQLQWAHGATVLYRQGEGLSVFHHHEWIEGDRGALCIEADRVTLVTATRRPRRVSLWIRRRPEQVVLDELLSALRDGRPSSLDVEDNLGTVAIVEAAARSADSSQPIDLPELPSVRPGSGPPRVSG